ncbi:MAG: AmmeMemoRadiSam system protein B [Candidatus Kerfeldbacteria bacterium]
MIVFSAFVPHPPIIIPEIGKDNFRFLKKTVDSMKKLNEDLYASKPDSIIIISPHGPMQSEAFSLNMSPEFEINFEDFGDLKTKIKITGDIGLIHHYKEILEAKTPVVLTHKIKLDHGAGIPLYYFKDTIKEFNTKIIPIYYSLLDYKKHFEFGQKLQEDMINDTKRIAIIASGDLSHRLTEDAPAGYSHWAKKFDQTIQDKIMTKNSKDLIDLDHDFIEEAHECGLRSLLILMGMMNSIAYIPEIYSYEGPLGVGYLTVNFKLTKY